MLKTDFLFSFAVASSHLERDIFQYYRYNGCKIHDEYDVNDYCALSRPTRWAFTIFDQGHIYGLSHIENLLHINCTVLAFFCFFVFFPVLKHFVVFHRKSAVTIISF